MSSSSAISTQLTVELTNLVPLASIATLISRASFQILRSIARSGSDPFTEATLAQILGRGVIEINLARTFREILGQNTTYGLSALNEILLEAGPGPTVTRSLTENDYFGTVVQLSLLTYCHDIENLTQNLIKALERRSVGSKEPVDLPSHTLLKGTLEACRTQTSRFQWESWYQAIEVLLHGVVLELKPYESRPLTLDLLQALLDMLPAIQRYPDSVIRIEATTGFVTVIVWAYIVLGLTVTLESDKTFKTFGQGREKVIVICRGSLIMHDSSSVSLLDETKDLQFRITSNHESDSPLEPECRYPAHGYGRKHLLFAFEEAALVDELSHRITASCLRLAGQTFDDRSKHISDATQGEIFPSRFKIMDAGSLLFGDLQYDSKYFQEMLDAPCLCTSNWAQIGPNLPQTITDYLAEYEADDVNENIRARNVKREMRYMSLIVLNFATIKDLSSCQNLPLSLYPRGVPMQVDFRLPTATQSFQFLAKFLLGSAYDAQKVDRAALVSAWGWSMLVKSIDCDDPSDVRPEIEIREGVPTRFDERRPWILDEWAYNPSSSWGARSHNGGSAQYKCTSVPGDRAVLQNLSKARNSMCQVTVTNDAFIVYKQFELEDSDSKPDAWVGTRIGFRTMQEMCWRTIALPYCDHRVHLGEEIEVPDGVWCFSGVEHPRIKWPDDNPQLTMEDRGWVHAGLVAGSSAARWVLLSSMLRWSILTSSSVDGEPYQPVFLRPQDCCFRCALNATRSKRRGRVLGLVL